MLRGWGMSDNGDAPKPRALDAMQTAVDDLQTAHANADNAAEAGVAENEHVSQFVDELAAALVDGLDEPVGLFAGAVADETEYYTKTDLKQKVSDAVEERRNAGKPALDQYILDHLEKVIVVKTTDARQGADYIWDFDTFQVETQSGRDRRGHFSWLELRDLLHEGGGVVAAPPEDDRKDSEVWRDFITGVIDDQGDERLTRGPRTDATEQLANLVKRLTGYGTPEAALDHTGIWVVQDHPVPRWWATALGDSPNDDRDLPEPTVEEIRIHESRIEPVLDDTEITRSALYHELDARGHTVPGAGGASTTEWVNGANERFWTLLPSLAVPQSYIPDPYADAPPARGGSVLGASSDEPTEQTDAGADTGSTAIATTDGGEQDDERTSGFDSVGDAT